MSFSRTSVVAGDQPLVFRALGQARLQPDLGEHPEEVPRGHGRLERPHRQQPSRHATIGGEPISGSTLGRLLERTIAESNLRVPILVDAGVGTASDAAIAMELGCDGILMNTAIAAAQNPVLMASAMKKATEAGREAFLAGRMPKKRFASASSPVDGLFF